MTEATTGKGDLPKVILQSADGATADICTQGATITSWRPATDGAERLFLSGRSEFREGAAIRGGIPVIFPQFAMEGSLPRHGLVRSRAWTVARVERDDAGNALTSLVFEDTAETRAIWPASFRTSLSARVGGASLEITLTVENTGEDSFAFAAALHTYLRVADVRTAEIHGLNGARYRVSGDTRTLQVEQTNVIQVTDEIDRVYVNAPPSVLLREQSRAMQIESSGFPDIVLWNPGAERASALEDMEPGGERYMLCVEAAAVQSPIELDAGRTWSGAQTLVALSADT